MFELIFTLLISELLVVGLLIAPLSPTTRRGLTRSIESSEVLTKARNPAIYFTAALGFAAVYCLLDVVRAQKNFDAATSGTELRFESLLHRAQRNTLLTGGATLLLLVVHRLFALIKEVNQLTASKEALMKQAEGAAAAYKAASAEVEALKKGPVKKAAGDDDPEDELARAKEVIATLRERTQKLMAEKEAATKDAEALKKQAKGLSDEYGRLLAQKESLENKLADFELILGDDLKKSK